MITTRDAQPDEMPWVLEFLKDFGAPIVICGKQRHDLRTSRAIIAEHEGQRVGAITFKLEDNNEVHALVMRSARQRKGIGRALMLAMLDSARALGAPRVHFTTTNDNLPAQALHASVGCTLIHRDIGGFADIMRMLGYDPKRSTMLGYNNQPITDILHYEKVLTSN